MRPGVMHAKSCMRASEWLYTWHLDHSPGMASGTLWVLTFFLIRTFQLAFRVIYMFPVDTYGLKGQSLGYKIENFAQT